MINPVILKASEEHQQEMEGCLSVPGVWAITDRPMTVTVRAMNRKGEYFFDLRHRSDRALLLPRDRPSRRKAVYR